MFRTQLATNYLKRTVRPLYGWTQATPKSGYLDPSWARSAPIYPGFVLTKTAGNNYTLIGSATVNQGTGASGETAAAEQPAGLVSQWIGGAGIDELLESGVNALSVWVLGPDAEFEILAPAFDTVGSVWSAADFGTGFDTYLYAYTAVTSGTTPAGVYQGQLCLPATTHGVTTNNTPAGATIGSVPVARLIQVESTNSIIIGGLPVRAAV